MASEQSGSKRTIKVGDRAVECEVHPLPQAFIEWQVATRREGITSFLEGNPRFSAFGAHLPVMSTADVTTGTFPVNSAAKGAGLCVRPEAVEEWTLKFEGLTRRGLEAGWQETMRERLEALLDYYSDVSRFDPTVITSIELFGKRTYKNVLADPRVTLLYVGFDDSGTRSYAVHCVAELVPPGELFYRYVRATHDLFHVPSRRTYPFVYRLHVCEVYDKTPGPRASERLV